MPRLTGKQKFIVGAAAGLAVVAAAGAAVASSEDDRPLRGRVFDRATAAALEHTGEGSVTDTEVGDDGAAYGVEVRLEDGSQVEVELDAGFGVVGTEQDDE